MKIGEKIKQLRNSRGITQETLANHLGISFQAVSKWENGTALPDITLVPALSTYFGVSADELLGLQDAADAAELAEYETQFWDEYWQHGNPQKGQVGRYTQKSTDICREVLEKYPNNLKWMSFLVRCLIPAHNDNVETWSKSALEEALALCERILLEECPDGYTRDRARWVLCKYYGEVGKRKRAIEIAHNAPMTQPAYAKDSLLEIAYDGEERVQVLQENLREYLLSCDHLVYKLSRDPHSGYSLQDKLHCLETLIELSNTFYQGETNPFFGSEGTGRYYYDIARLYAGEQDAEHFDAQKAMEYLLKAEAEARQYDGGKFGERRPYKSIFLNKLEYGHGNVYVQGGPYVKMLAYLHGLIKAEPCFDSMKDVPAFAELMARIKPSE